MPVYNIYYFVIKPLRIRTSSGATGVVLESPGSDSPVVQGIFDGFRTKLIDLMNQSKAHIPHRDSRNQTINVLRIPALQGNPVSPDFSGITVNMGEPIVYFTTRELDSSPSDQFDRRPEYTMLEALRNARCQEFPSSWVSEQRSYLGSAGEHNGLSLPGIPGVSYPVTACVFSDARENYAASNWDDLLANSLATTAFHEIAHCKTETDNRSRNSRWESALTGSMHDVSNVQVLARDGAGRDPSPADFELMGKHMLCPINFYRLDQNINDQCFTEGEIVQLTPRP